MYRVSLSRSLRRFLLVGGIAVASEALAQPARPFSTSDGRPGVHFKFLEPGFTIRELPVRLNAINNLAYASDGRLFAAGYNGQVWALRDTDNDGLEDAATLFWEGKQDYAMPLGMVVRGDSVYVTLRRRIERLRDTNGDGVADVSEVAGTHWHQPEIEKDDTFKQRRVDDAIGLAMDAYGRLYTTLGTPNHANGWQVDESGKSRYRRERFRGSVIRIGADGQPEQIASGVRFSVALQFNRHGDLFATDQEGYTWGPGNPYDELLHIVPGRHYGFPPQHSKWLPDVIDEPSVVDFGPMHQSTCGFCFNEARNGLKRFGPPEWEDNAIVTGASRGKIWRVPLVKTRGGYAGRPVLIGSVNLLPIDVCLSPTGDLLVACHGGKPDWGNGPNSEGRIYKISYTAPQAPRVAAVWPASATEVRVALSAPLPVGAVFEAEIVGGRYVRAGDEFETFRPGYKVITDEQLASPRHHVAVHSTEISADRRELTLTTAPHPWQCNYAVKLRWSGTELHADYSFGGVHVAWIPLGSNEPAWRGWLPHPNLDVARGWTLGSVTHDALFARLADPGTLQLDGAIAPRDLAQWQEIEAIERVKKENSGSLAAPDGAQTIELLAAGAGSWTLGEARAEFTANTPSRLERSAGDAPVPFHILLSTGSESALTFVRTTTGDPIVRTLPPSLVLVPDAPALPAPGAPPEPAHARQFARGDAGRGRQIFETTCVVCHAFRGRGGEVGPDLTNSPERDAFALLADITTPNASLNPDHIGYELTRRDGSVLIGVIASDRPGRFLVHQADGTVVNVEQAEIVAQRQVTKSIMPEGYAELGAEQLSDLVTYLTSRDE